MQRLKQEVRKLTQSQLVRSVAKISGGTLLGQVVVLLASPLLTRLYTPEEFGVLGIYTAIVSVVAIMASLKYEQAIPVTAKNDQHSLFALSLILVVGVSVLSFAICLLFQPLLVRYIGEAASLFVWLLPLGIFVAGLYQLLSAWAIRLEAYGQIGQTKVTQGVGMTIVQVAAGAMGGSHLGLILGDMVGRSSGVTTLGRLLKQDWLGLRGAMSVNHLKTAKEYAHYPRYIGSATLLSSASLYVPYIALQALYSPATVGWFLLVQRIVTAPSSLIGRAIANVYYGRASEAMRNGVSPYPLFRKGAMLLFAVGLPFTLVSVAFVVPVFGVVFGADWAGAGVYVQILAPAYLMSFIAVPFSQSFNVTDQHRSQLLMDGLRFVLGILPFLLALWLELSDVATIYIYSAGLFFSYAALLFQIRRSLRRMR